jgi:3'(2'), 5'-bisphosphate nucleotidase
VEDRRPTYGFIYVPIIDGSENGVIYYTDENKKGIKFDLDSGEKVELSVKNKGIDLDEILKKEVSVVTSGPFDNSGIPRVVPNIKVGSVKRLSSSLKFCKMAEGEYDLYVHSRNTHEWDTAAGHAIILGAGGRLQNIDRSELLYNKERFLNAEFLVY